MQKFILDNSRYRGIAIASSIVGLWTSSLCYLLSCDVVSMSLLTILLAIFLQTFFNTGLFITAHDAMHGLVCPQNRQINHSIGILSISLYGLFPYEKLLKKHCLHHRYPASFLDPDYHHSENESFVVWYFHFMKEYWNWNQFIKLVLIVTCLGYVLNISPINLILFWGLPFVMSSLQLFYFGTFLVHKQPREGYHNSHHARDIILPVWLSLLACYHFGYHEKHHQFPHIPWWELQKKSPSTQ